MTSADFACLIADDEPAPAALTNYAGASPLLLTGDHAGNRVPRALAGLGVAPADLARHIGWDIGVAELGRTLAARLDAVFIEQVYSRLVIDCNRDPTSADAIPEISDATAIPGNRALSAPAAAWRIRDIHAPYHTAIAAEIARRSAAGQPTILIALHSFTPQLADGAVRPWDIGVLHDRGNTGFARALLAALQAQGDLVVGDNAPYRMDDTDHSVPRHAYAGGLAYAEIEVRQDLIGDAAGVERWCDRLGAALAAAQRG